LTERITVRFTTTVIEGSCQICLDMRSLIVFSFTSLILMKTLTTLAPALFKQFLFRHFCFWVMTIHHLFPFLWLLFLVLTHLINLLNCFFLYIYNNSSTYILLSMSSVWLKLLDSSILLWLWGYISFMRTSKSKFKMYFLFYLFI
jgi:hypothetical protein